MQRNGMIFAVVLVLAQVAGADAGDGKSAFESDPKGWTDLMPGKDLKGWRRVPLPPDKEPVARNPWSVSADGKTLLCRGEGIKEMFLHETERGDGIFHVEWRFQKSDKDEYNSGVYVRSAVDGKIWHQAQVAHLKKSPNAGDLFGETLVGGKADKFLKTGSGADRAKPVGEWNTYEITGRGKSISVWLNGAEVTTWKECEVPRGHVGMQAEYYTIEFRNILFKPLIR